MRVHRPGRRRIHFGQNHFPSSNVNFLPPPPFLLTPAIDSRCARGPPQSTQLKTPNPNTPSKFDKLVSHRKANCDHVGIVASVCVLLPFVAIPSLFHPPHGTRGEGGSRVSCGTAALSSVITPTGEGGQDNSRAMKTKFYIIFKTKQ